MNEVISIYILNEEKWNVKIEYSYKPPERDTAYRFFCIVIIIVFLNLNKVYNFFKEKATLVLLKNTWKH